MGDYVAFSLPVPAVCADIFAQLSTGNSSHLPRGYNPFNIAGNVGTSNRSGHALVALDDFEWQKSLGRWISVELQVAGVARHLSAVSKAL